MSIIYVPVYEQYVRSGERITVQFDTAYETLAEAKEEIEKENYYVPTFTQNQNKWVAIGDPLKLAFIKKIPVKDAKSSEVKMQHQENVWEKFFGTADRAVETFKLMGCLNPDEFEDCTTCPFWSYAACPAYPQGANGKENLLEVLKETAL